LKECIESGKTRIRTVRVDGGVSNNDFLCQFIADICQVQVIRGENTEATVTGAAMLAGISRGWWSWDEKGRNRMRELVQNNDTIFEPKMSAKERDARFALWHDAVQRVVQ